MSNSIEEFKVSAVGTYAYKLPQYMYVLFVSGMKLVKEREETEDDFFSEGPTTQDNLYERCIQIAEEITDDVFEAYPEYTHETIFEIVSLAAFVSMEVTDEMGLDARCESYIGSYLPKEDNMDRTDYITEKMNEAEVVRLSPDYTALDWSLYYLESLIALDEKRPEKEEYGVFATGRAQKLVTSSFYDGVREFDYPPNAPEN